MTVTTSESFKFTKDFLLISISTICYARSLLPGSCFEERKFNIAGTTCKTKVLLKGSHKEADKVLSMIDNIYSALEKVEIDFMKVAIAGNPASLGSADFNNCVYEVYTFDFRYSLMLISPTADCIPIQEYKVFESRMRKQFFATVNALIDTMKPLEPLLPSKKLCVILGTGETNNGNEAINYTAGQLEVSGSAKSNPKVSHHLATDQDFERRVGEDPDDVGDKVGIFDTMYCRTQVSFKVILPDSPQAEPGVPSNKCECGSHDNFSFATTDCKVCSRSIHMCCYGANGKSKPSITCHTCIFKKRSVPPDLVQIMRIRFLWRYFTDSDLPTSTAFFTSLFPDSSGTTQMLNTMIKYSILEISGTLQYLAKSQTKFKAKTGYIKVDMEGLEKDTGEPLEMGEKYYFMFSPLLIYRNVTDLKYDKDTKVLFMPETREVTAEELEQRCSKVFGTSPRE